MARKGLLRNLFYGFLLLLSVGLIVYFCVDDNNFITLINSLRYMNFFWLFFSFLAILLVWFFDSTVLYNISKPLNALSLRKCFKCTMIGQFFSSVSPYAVAGQPMQIVYLTSQGVSAGNAMSIVVRKFLAYQTTIASYSLVVILTQFYFFEKKVNGFMYLTLIGFLSQVFIILFILLFAKGRKFTTKLINFILKMATKLHIIKNPNETINKIESQLQLYLDSIKDLRSDRKLQVKLYTTMFIQIAALFSIPFFIYKAFGGAGFPIISMLSAQTFITMISSATPLPGGSGAYESMFLVFFGSFFAHNIIKPAMLLWRFISYYSCIIVGFFFSNIKKDLVK